MKNQGIFFVQRPLKVTKVEVVVGLCSALFGRVRDVAQPVRAVAVKHTPCLPHVPIVAEGYERVG